MLKLLIMEWILQLFFHFGIIITLVNNHKFGPFVVNLNGDIISLLKCNQSLSLTNGKIVLNETDIPRVEQFRSNRIQKEFKLRNMGHGGLPAGNLHNGGKDRLMSSSARIVVNIIPIKKTCGGDTGTISLSLDTGASQTQ